VLKCLSWRTHKHRYRTAIQPITSRPESHPTRIRSRGASFRSPSPSSLRVAAAILKRNENGCPSPKKSRRMMHVALRRLWPCLGGWTWLNAVYARHALVHAARGAWRARLVNSTTGATGMRAQWRPTSPAGGRGKSTRGAPPSARLGKWTSRHDAQSCYWPTWAHADAADARPCSKTLRRLPDWPPATAIECKCGADQPKQSRSRWS
jgi:hypothetical protein